MQLRGANFLSSGRVQALFTGANLAVAWEVREISLSHVVQQFSFEFFTHSLALGGAILAGSYMQLSGYV